jgi:epoxyqueuosine reductase
MRASELERIARSKGADLVGFAHASKFPTSGDEKLNPKYYLPDAQNVVVLGLKLVDAIWDKLSGAYDVHSTNLLNYLRHYNYDLLDFIAVQTARYIEEEGYDAYPIQARTESKTQNVFTGYFPFKEAARLAGLGGYGKNSQIITPEYGPRVRLVCIITNLDIDGVRGKKTLGRTTDDICGNCNICIEKCPVQAISYTGGIPIVDRRKCQGYMDVAQNCALCQGICIRGKEAAMKRRKKRERRASS